LTRAELALGAADRLAPILMTALVKGLALVPLLILGGRVGGEIEEPLALVVIGGLASSTALNHRQSKVLSQRSKKAPTPR
jgi:Cu/Ag efflux pump CusA